MTIYSLPEGIDCNIQPSLVSYVHPTKALDGGGLAENFALERLDRREHWERTVGEVRFHQQNWGIYTVYIYMYIYPLVMTNIAMV